MDELSNWKQCLFLGAIAYEQREYKHAEQLLRQALKERSHQREESFEESLPVVLENLALVLVRQSRLIRAERVLKRALRLAKSRQAACRLTFKLAELYLQQGKFSVAERFTASAITLGESCEIRDSEMEVLHLIRLANSWNNWGQLQTAVDMLHKAQEVRRHNVIPFDSTSETRISISFTAPDPIEQFAESG